MNENMQKLPSEVKEAINALEGGQKRTFTFLLIGRTGVGKSSTINSLLGHNVAPVGHHKPETKEVKKYRHTVEGVTFEVVDTPGLCDNLPERGYDEDYLNKIKAEVSDIDCLWFVTELNAPRVSGDEQRAIQLINKAFGKEVWHHAIIIFTRADLIRPREYQTELEIRTQLIREAIRDVSPPNTRYRPIASVAVSNKQDALNGNPWLNQLYMTVFKSISRMSLIPFYLGTVSRLVTEKERSDPNRSFAPGEIPLTSENEQDMKEEITKHPVLRIFKRLGISALMSGIGTVIGGVPGGIVTGVVGNAISFIVDLFRD